MKKYIPYSEITDEKWYLNRRLFMRAGILAATTVASGLAYRKFNARSQTATDEPVLADLAPATQPDMSQAFRVDEPQTPYQAITHYNNFYEFSTDKEAVAEVAAGFISRPWTVTVGGLVRNPTVFDLDDLLKISPPEERVYRMRCVEAWSMVIPWAGLPLSKLLDRVEPLSSAKYVAFQTLVDPARMPNQRRAVLPWPYVEGLRIDEAMHPLTILASGIYGRQIPPQNGAPLRLVVPWKYGFKGIKSIVKIDLVDKQPPSTWNIQAPNEYGFYCNVNPTVDHPRWSQATERRIGPETRMQPTLMFNGYAEQVAHLYAGMDLREFLSDPQVKDPRFAKSIVFINSVLPLALLGWDAYQRQLGTDPQAKALHTVGLLALIFLFLSLSITPIRKITGWNWLSHFRRMLGLFAFFYGVVHLLIYVNFYLGFSIARLADETQKRPFILLGMGALLMMLPLAITSTNGMIKRLGAARWKLLHRLAYPAAIAGLIHYRLASKVISTPQNVFTAILVLLLGYRMITSLLSAIRRKSAPARAGAVD